MIPPALTLPLGVYTLSLYFGALHIMSPESRATDFGSGPSLTHPMAGGPHSGGLHPWSPEPRATDFGSGPPFTYPMIMFFHFEVHILGLKRRC